jgi:hypothetical protein
LTSLEADIKKYVRLADFAPGVQILTLGFNKVESKGKLGFQMSKDSDTSVSKLAFFRLIVHWARKQKVEHY